jgi:hypothetical protein
MLSQERDIIPLSESAVSNEIEEIDEALHHASETKNKPDFSPEQREIVEQFIDELLDTRLELKKC